MAVKVDGLEIAVKSTVKGLNSFKSLEKSIVRLTMAVSKLGTRLPALSSSVSKVSGSTKKAEKSTDAYSRKLKELQEYAAQSRGAISKQAKAVQEAWDALKGSNKTNESIKKTASAAKKMGEIFSSLGKKVASVFKAIGRIIFYRAIRAALRTITGAFREGIENLYQWSKAGEDNGKFADSMDRIATAVKYLKNALATLVAPLINSAAPVIDQIIDTIVAGINKINEMIARIRGDDFWYKAVKVPVEFADGTKEATAAVKDFMMGWDELNVINDSRGSGSGASSALLDMFDTEKVDNPSAGTSLFSTIKARFNNMIDNLKKKWDEWGLSDTIEKFVTEYLPTIINYVATAAIYVGEIVGALTLPALKGTLNLIMDILDLIGGEGSTIGTLMSIGVDFVEMVVGPWISLIDTVAGWFGVETEGGSIFSQAVDELRRMLKGGLWDEFGQLMKNGIIYIWQQIILPTLKVIFGIGGYLFKWLGEWADGIHEAVFGWEIWKFSFGDIIDLIMGRGGHTSTKASIDKNESKITDFWKQLVAKLKEKYTVAFAAGETGLSFGGWIAKQIITGILNGLIQRIKETVGKWMTPWVTFKTEFKKSWTESGQDADIAKKVDESIFDKIVSWWKTSPVGRLATAITDAFKAAAEKLPDWVKRLLGIQIPQKTIGVGGGGASGGPTTVTWYANGGTPNTGSLFWAGEAGPELVDRVGGQTTVYNAGQLAQELSVANTGVVGAIYGMRDAVVGAIAAKDTTVRISGGDIGRANAEYQRKRGVYVNTGAFANAY